MKNDSGHPAQFSPEVVALLGSLIEEGVHVHDPCAGPGVRLGQLCRSLGCGFSGTEIEPEFIVDYDVVQGDATDFTTYPKGGRFTIVTSPVYPNGIADDFVSSGRHFHLTYRAALARIRGFDKPMHPNNQGRWGYRGTPLHSNARAVYWNLARRMADCWQDAERVLLNVSDFQQGKVTEPVVAGWRQVLERRNWRLEADHEVGTRRYRNGQNRDARVEVEHVLDYRR